MIAKKELKINKIDICGLFGLFDHTIEMKTKKGITIISGPNGLGKTTILELIYNLFNGHFYSLFRIPFDNLDFFFDNGSKLQIKRIQGSKKTYVVYDEKNISKKKEADEILSFRLFTSKGVKSEEYKIKLSEYRSAQNIPPVILRRELRKIPFIDEISPIRYIYHRTGEVLRLDELFEKYYDEIYPYIEDRFLPKAREKHPEWLEEIVNSFPVYFIRSERLTIYKEDNPRSKRAVEEYSEKLKSDIKKELEKYAELSQTLDRAFPSSLVEKLVDKKDPIHNQETISIELNNLELKRKKLTEVGILGGMEKALVPPENLDNYTIRVLSLYVENTKEKLAVFDNISGKIEILLGIINDLFEYKKMSIDRENGFVFKQNVPGHNRIINLKNLSSGEQHELVINYELLFKIKPRALILIDEPEISLHVTWQIKFLSNLEKIIKKSNFSALIATHSPQIINDRFDLLIQLKGYEYGNKM